MIIRKESSLKGKNQYNWLPCTNLLRRAALNADFFYKTSYLNEVIHTEPSHLVRIPCYVAGSLLCRLISRPKVCRQNGFRPKDVEPDDEKCFIQKCPWWPSTSWRSRQQSPIVQCYKTFLSLSPTIRTNKLEQGILKGEASLYCWPPICLVLNQLYDNWQFLFLFTKQANPNQSNRRSMVHWYFPPSYSLARVFVPDKPFFNLV
jgi:hypothetical protein